jgi:hypothetical protein
MAGLERRVKLLLVPFSELQGMLVACAGYSDGVRVQGLPAGFSIERVYVSGPCLGVMLHHPSFEEVQDGEEVPVIEADWDIVLPRSRGREFI